MPKLSDHAGGRPGAAATKKAGYQGSVRYLANSPERGLPNKILTPAEAKEYIDLGLFLVSNWQKGKHDTADWKRGFEGGKTDAQLASFHHLACGGDVSAPIFFSIDEDIYPSQWESQAKPYLLGAGTVIGQNRVGVYGGLDTMEWADRDQVAGLNGQGQKWLWQTRAWSRRDGKLTWHPTTVLRQELVCPPDNASIAGITVDVNYTYAEDFGQWFYPRGGASSTQDDRDMEFLYEQAMGRQ
jgi:hypothetical protein